MPCLATEGRVVDSRGRCVCDSSRGLVARGDECVPAAGCRRDADCDDSDLCRGETCVPACQAEPCGVHAMCTAIGHRSICNCANGYTGNPKEQCTTTPNYRTDFPLPEMQVSDSQHYDLIQFLNILTYVILTYEPYFLPGTLLG